MLILANLIEIHQWTIVAERYFRLWSSEFDRNWHIFFLHVHTYKIDICHVVVWPIWRLVESNTSVELVAFFLSDMNDYMLNEEIHRINDRLVYTSIEYISVDQSTMFHEEFRYNDWIFRCCSTRQYVQLICNIEVPCRMDIVAVFVRLTHDVQRWLKTMDVSMDNEDFYK